MSRITKAVRAVALLAGLAAAGSAVAVASAAGASTPHDNIFAKVAADGSLLAGHDVSSFAEIGTGQYEITFTQDVSGCAYVATTENSADEARQVYTAGGHNSANGVYVETKNQGGGLTPAPFDLVVDCGSATTGFAVVDYNGGLSRSSSGVSLDALGAGRYDVTFPMAVNTCAALATVGDPGNGLVYGPAGAYTGEGPDTHTIYVETKNVGGGLQDGVPFHLAVLCAGTPGVHGAIVPANGISTKVFGSALSYRGNTGLYDLVTNTSLTQCAVVATRGSVSKAVPYTPATVELGPGPSANVVGVQVRDLLQNGNAYDNQSFHVAAVC